MPLSYYPRPGEILVCHFDKSAIGAEMVKTRPVVVIGPRLRNRGHLATVVPLSTTDPDPIEAYHFELVLERSLPPPFDSPRMWAKCDMISVVSMLRLDRFKEPRGWHGGARKWTTGMLGQEQLDGVTKSVLAALGHVRP